MAEAAEVSAEKWTLRTAPGGRALVWVLVGFVVGVLKDVCVFVFGWVGRAGPRADRQHANPTQNQDTRTYKNPIPNANQKTLPLQLRQLVEMRREERPAAGVRGEALGHGPGDAEAVRGGGAAVGWKALLRGRGVCRCVGSWFRR